MFDVKTLLGSAIERSASDLHLKVGARPHIRVEGQLEPLESEPVFTAEDAAELTRQILSPGQRELLSTKPELDLACSFDGLGRFRLAIFRQRQATSFVFRIIPTRIPTIEELNLPPVLREIADDTRGLILVTGSSGNGKSTTLAAMVEHINQTRPTHILTIEDPIEFLFRDKKSFITQREVSIDTGDFSSALRAALRQDPDVILVGEMRDQETVQTALQAAETGHLVMSTLHTTDAVETVNRIISMFPLHQQQYVRIRIAATLRAVISMRLIRSSITGRRIPAVEVLRSTELVRSLILDPDKTSEIRRALTQGRAQYGMQSFDQSLFDHFQNRRISADDALRHATFPDDLKLKIQGVVSSSEGV